MSLKDLNMIGSMKTSKLHKSIRKLSTRFSNSDLTEILNDPRNVRKKKSKFSAT